MITPEALTDTVAEWFETLDYEFMILHITLCYGLYFSKNMEWVVKKLGGLTYSVWKVGAFLAFIEILRFLPYFEGGFTLQKVVSILHSYLVVQVFVDDVVKMINRWVKILKRTENQTPTN